MECFEVKIEQREKSRKGRPNHIWAAMDPNDGAPEDSLEFYYYYLCTLHASQFGLYGVLANDIGNRRSFLERWNRFGTAININIFVPNFQSWVDTASAAWSISTTASQFNAVRCTISNAQNYFTLTNAVETTAGQFIVINYWNAQNTYFMDELVYSVLWIYMFDPMRTK